MIYIVVEIRSCQFMHFLPIKDHICRRHKGHRRRSWRSFYRWVAIASWPFSESKGLRNSITFQSHLNRPQSHLNISEFSAHNIYNYIYIYICIDMYIYICIYIYIHWCVCISPGCAVSCKYCSHGPEQS